MPATGGLVVVERYGGGENNSDATTLQRVFESIAAQRGSAYDQTTESVVGVENLAIARAITFDGYGTNQRLANQFLPAKMTADGLLPRWEAIFNISTLPTDTEVVRRARVAAAFSRLGQPNTHQPIVDALTVALGALFTGTILYQIPGHGAFSIWPGASNNTPTIPWYSTIDHIAVGINLPAAYTSSSGGPNAAWWQALNAGVVVLDAMLPAWMTWNFFILSSHGTACWYLDDPSNLDTEIFCA